MIKNYAVIDGRRTYLGSGDPARYRRDLPGIEIETIDDEAVTPRPPGLEPRTEPLTIPLTDGREVPLDYFTSLRRQAYDHARGDYQRAILDGTEPISGKSKTRWGKTLNLSRRALLERLREAGIPWEIQREGKAYVLVFGDEPRRGPTVIPDGAWYPREGAHETPAGAARRVR